MPRTYILSLIAALTTIYLPDVSTIWEWITQSRPFLIKIATPREFELPWEQISSAPHSFFHFNCVDNVEWVSCRNIISEFRFRHHVKIVRLFLKLLSPLALRDSRLREWSVIRAESGKWYYRRSHIKRKWNRWYSRVQENIVHINDNIRPKTNY